MSLTDVPGVRTGFRTVVDNTVPWAPDAHLIGVNVPRPLWLRMRRRGIGGSDASAVWGMNPYRSAWATWVDKLGHVDDGDSEAAMWGRVLEAPVAGVAAERNGLEIMEWGALMFEHAEIPYMLANPDRLSIEPDGTPVGMEIKTTSLWLSDQWDGDELPGPALLQAVHCMAVLGCSAWWVFGLIGGQRLAGQRVERDLALERIHLDACAGFWQHVVDGTPPPADGSKATTDAMSVWYSPADPDLVVTLDSAQLELVRCLNDAKTTVKAAEKARDELANQVRDLLGHAETAITSDGIVATTWKQQGPRKVALPAAYARRIPYLRHPSDINNVRVTEPGNRPLLTKKV